MGALGDAAHLPLLCPDGADAVPRGNKKSLSQWDKLKSLLFDHPLVTGAITPSVLNADTTSPLTAREPGFGSATRE